MPPEEPPPTIDIPPPPEYERLAELKDRREELEKKLADEKAKFKRMQADRRALLRKQIKQAKSRLTTAERKRRTQRLIQLGLLLEAWGEQDPALHDRTLKALDDRLTRNNLRALFGLPPLGEPPPSTPPKPPAVTSAPLGSEDNPIPGWRPHLIDSHDWGSIFKGEATALPDELVGLWIRVSRGGGETFLTKVTKTTDRTDHFVIVRDSGKPDDA